MKIKGKCLFIWHRKRLSKTQYRFFEKWGLGPNDEVRGKIENLNLPKLEKEIWKATDSNIIREKQVKPYGGLPYGEASNVVQDLIVGANFNENLANSLVQNLGENVKVTGRIMWLDLEVGKKSGISRN